VWFDPEDAEEAEDTKKSFPKVSRSWPVAEGRIDLYKRKTERCAMMLFYPLGQELPENGYYVNDWEKEWLYLHAPITSFGPSLAILGFAKRAISLFFNPSSGAGGLDTATEIDLPMNTKRLRKV